MQKKPLWKIILCDFLVFALLLLSFSFFHHGLTWLKGKAAKAAAETVIQADEEAGSYDASETVTEASADGDTAAGDTAESETIPSEETVSEDTEEESAEDGEASEAVPDDRTEWQIKFADHFTEEIIQTETSYSSPNIAINVTKHVGGDVVDGTVKDRVVYYVADIYVASIECFRTWLAHNSYELYGTQNILEMDAESGSLLSMTGDFYSYQYSGFMIRNGIAYRNSYTDSDICVLYKDGTMVTYAPEDDYSRSELIESGDVWQVWNFGPMLLTAEGEMPSSYNVSTTVSFINPRSAVGYYEPGHYCFVVVDGRDSSWSEGMILSDLSQVFYDLGCQAAYNLDGGGSAVMAFNDEIISHQSNGGDRELGDILIIVEPPADGWDSYPVPDGNPEYSIEGE